MKFPGNVKDIAMQIWLNFGGSTDHSLDAGIFKKDLLISEFFCFLAK